MEKDIETRLFNAEITPEYFMSSYSLFSSLYIECRNIDQMDQVCTQFKESEGGADYIIEALRPIQYTQPPLIKVYLYPEDLTGRFDQRIRAFDQWLWDTFSLRLSGYWMASDQHLSVKRYEIKNGDIAVALCDWLYPYTVEQIEDICQYAEFRYSKKENTPDIE